MEKRKLNLLALDHKVKAKQLVKKQKKQKKKLNLFVASASVAVVMAMIGGGMMIGAKAMKNQEYNEQVAIGTIESCREALNINKVKMDAYEALIAVYRNNTDTLTTKQLDVARNALRVGEAEMTKDERYVDLCYSLGSLYFYCDLNEELPTRLKNANEYFEKVVKTVEEENLQYENYEMAKNFCALNDFFATVAGNSGVNEATKADYEKLLDTMEECLNNLSSLEASDAKYMQITTCDAICYLVTDKRTEFADFGISKERLKNLINNAANYAGSIGGITKTKTLEIQRDIEKSRDDYINKINTAYANTSIRNYLSNGEGVLS